ncbi:MAG: hypothetical protein ACTSU2_16395 [Promethearchaeota archaeon]
MSKKKSFNIPKKNNDNNNKEKKGKNDQKQEFELNYIKKPPFQKMHDVLNNIDEKKAHNTNRNENLKSKMVETLPQIYNALYPSGVSLITSARITLEDLKEELTDAIKSNPELVEKQRKLFYDVLNKISKINNRLRKMHY